MNAKIEKEREKENSPTDLMDSGSEYSIILFDGVCNLCNGWINFVIDHDSAGRFRFAPLQSEAGQRILLEHGSPAKFLDSIVLVEDGQIYFYSSSILRTVRRFDGIWSILYIFTLIPAPLRDWIYRQVASRRYQWFGRQDTCRIPTPDLEARFLK